MGTLIGGEEAGGGEMVTKTRLGDARRSKKCS